MNLIDYFNLKNILGVKSKAYSLRFGRNKKFYTHNKPSSNQKIYESPLTRNYLPKIQDEMNKRCLLHFNNVIEDNNEKD